MSALTTVFDGQGGLKFKLRAVRQPIEGNVRTENIYGVWTVCDHVLLRESVFHVSLSFSGFQREPRLFRRGYNKERLHGGIEWKTPLKVHNDRKLMRKAAIRH